MIGFAHGGIVSATGPGLMIFGSRPIGIVSARKRRSKGYRKHVRETKAAQRRQQSHRFPITVTLKTDITERSLMNALFGDYEREVIRRIGNAFNLAAQSIGEAARRLLASRATYEAAIKRIILATAGPSPIKRGEGRSLIPIGAADRAGLPPCGECHLRAGETCDICGARAPAGDDPPPAGPGVTAAREDTQPEPPATRAAAGDRIIWEDDGHALRYLGAQGYRIDRGWNFHCPADHQPTDEEKSAAQYLFDEWDMGGIVRPADPDWLVNTTNIR